MAIPQTRGDPNYASPGGVSRSPCVLAGVSPLGMFGDFVMAIARLLQWQRNNASRGFQPSPSFSTTQQYHKRGLSYMAIALPLGW